MGVLRGFERRLEGAVEGLFARAFRSGLQPIELAKAVQRYCEDHKHVTSNGVVAPNEYRLILNPEDLERMETYGSSLHRELGGVVRATCDDNGWRLYGDTTFSLEADDDILLGRFEIMGRIRATGDRDRGPDQDRDGDRRPASAPRAAAPAPAALFGDDRQATTDERPAGAAPAGPAPAGPAPASSVPPPMPIPPSVPPVVPPVPAAGPRQTPDTQAMQPARPQDPAVTDRQGPAPTRAAPLRLEVLDTGATLVLTSGRHTIGRSHDCDLTIDSTTVSRKHAVVVERRDTWWVFDLGSTNGTRVNGTRASELPIRPGDRVRIGTVELLVEEA